MSGYWSTILTSPKVRRRASADSDSCSMYNASPPQLRGRRRTADSSLSADPPAIHHVRPLRLSSPAQFLQTARPAMEHVDRPRDREAEGSAGGRTLRSNDIDIAKGEVTPARAVRPSRDCCRPPGSRGSAPRDLRGATRRAALLPLRAAPGGRRVRRRRSSGAPLRPGR